MINKSCYLTVSDFDDYLPECNQWNYCMQSMFDGVLHVKAVNQWDFKKRGHFNNLRNFRLFFELSQSDLGRLSGLTKNSICSIEIGDFDPSLFTAYRIVNAFRIVAAKHNQMFFSRSFGDALIAVFPCSLTAKELDSLSQAPGDLLELEDH